MSDMKGKRVIVTGPTSRVGRQIVLQLADLGAEVILACRDLQKGGGLSNEIESRTGQKAVVMMIDTSSQESIGEFAQEFRERYDRLDVLVNNAAVSRGKLPKIKSVDGIELTFATNVPGYFLLIQGLGDRIRSGLTQRTEGSGTPVNRTHPQSPSVPFADPAPFYNHSNPLCWQEIWAGLYSIVNDHQVLHRIVDILVGDQRDRAVGQATTRFGKLREWIDLISLLELPVFLREPVLVRFENGDLVVTAYLLVHDRGCKEYARISEWIDCLGRRRILSPVEVRHL